MNGNLLQRIKSKLNAKFYVMNDTWLSDCVEYFFNDKNPHEITDKHILEFVESQWQLSDLREISSENGCLPTNLMQQVRIVLTGTYILQSILLPGYKVMIIGPVDCRRGIILLEDGKYREIGGEVESMLKANALENILARALDEPENPDPYHDNGLLRNQINSNTPTNPTNENSFFDDDFEEAVDLEAVTAIEQQSQETVRTIQNQDYVPENIRGQRQNTQAIGNDTTEEFLEDIDFEPLENWSSKDPPVRPIRTLPTSRMEIDGFEDNDITIVEERSTFACSSRMKSSLPTKSSKKKDVTDFPDDDFAFDDCKIITESQVSQEQGRNSFKFKSETGKRSSLRTSGPRLTNDDIKTKVEKCTSVGVSTARKDISVASTSRTVQEIPKAKTISDFFAPPPPPKICDVLSDVLRENVTRTIYRMVRGKVKNHSTLTKQGKCWALTALITDHTSSVEVCFDSEILEKFLGFTVQEFSHKKKFAKSDPQVDSELRMSLRKAQHQIGNLDALLKLELTPDQMPKVVRITQQKGELTKRSACN
ncbi:PREDICTED: recQ-mediated genome instability protein 1-like isoform X2 [Dinoponera quadriceps]|uniref:RecQ-mediated genome instability protein 1 n=1 Tax=Dinoponera quadriceps TaxID=609295 RepID=A0A6P3WPT4_DINQU|nr:PREDICTED: recQ-mediated genome instability protein 1-like isoform X2 [Dinoponera quadriceps]